MKLAIEQKIIDQLFLIRALELEIAKKYSTGIFRCPVHLAIGQEALAVGINSLLDKEDLIFSSHRAHHHFIAKGGDPYSLLAEIAGLPSGCSGGNGGSTHLIDEKNGFMGSTAIISGVMPVASGVAHALKISKTNNIVTVFVGDAAVEEGVFFEVLNIVNLWNLPLLIVIEDNDLSCYTDKKTRQSYTSYQKIADLFNMPYKKIQGWKLDEVIENSKSIIDYVKKNNKPAIIHAEVFRALEHCGPEQDDHLVYRENKNLWPKLDPLFYIKSIETEKSALAEKKSNVEMTNLFSKLEREMNAYKL
jgi:pyruvate dehydrogenase E1 component alpha subunit